MIGKPEWDDDPRFATRQGWIDHLDDVIRPAIEAWAAADDQARGVPTRSAPPASPPGRASPPTEVVADPHVAARHMLVEMPRTDGVDAAGARARATR